MSDYTAVNVQFVEPEAPPAPEPEPEPASEGSAAEMLAMLPPQFYAESRIMRELFETEGTEFDKLRAAIDSMVDQWFARTATWGLDRWEAFLELPPPQSLSDAQRQERLIAKLRGVGTITPYAIKNVAESFTHGDIAVSDVSSGNKLTATEADFEGAITGWEAQTNCAVVLEDAVARTGSDSMRLTITAGGDARARLSAAGARRVIPRFPYYPFAWFRSASTERNVRAGITFYDIDDVEISTVNGPWTMEVDDEWVQTAEFEAIAPDNAYTARIAVEVDGGGAGEIHYVDSASLRPVADRKWQAPLADYTFSIEFISEAGEPTGLVDLQNVVTRTKPGHLAVEYVFNYLTLEELSAFGWTLAELGGDDPGGPTGAPLTLDELAEYEG